jgi:hypothetical protein
VAVPLVAWAGLALLVAAVPVGALARRRRRRRTVASVVPWPST